MATVTKAELIRAKIISYLQQEDNSKPDLMSIMNGVKSDSITPLRVIEELKNLECTCKVRRVSGGLTTYYSLIKNMA